MTRLDELVSTSADLGATRSRSAKIERLAALLRRLAPDEAEIGVAFLAGHARQGRIGVGPASLRAARGVAHAPQPSLSIVDVDRAFAAIAGAAGPGSAGARAAALADLFGRATGAEADFLIRLVGGELRQGALAGIMEEAVARATGLPVAAVRRAAMLAGDLEPVARAALVEGAAGLDRFRLELFRPLQPMLAQPADDLDDAMARLGEASLEWKLDGARVQVHRRGDLVRVYSRGLADVTDSAPELVTAVRALPVESAILDGEIIALAPDGAPLPFQTTMRRFGRRTDVARLSGDVPLTPFFFDLLHADGEDLLDRPLVERFDRLRAVAPGLVVPQRVTADPAAATAFLDDALARGHEGIMAKAPGAAYEAGRRGAAWLKLKREHTLDLVVLAVERGSGRRTGTLSNIHLGARDPATGGFVMLGKTFKGMTDAMLEWQTRRFRELAMADDGWVVHLRPEQVVEIAFNDVLESPHYPAGMALRFARVRRYREDKTAADADTVDAVRAIFARGR